MIKDMFFVILSIAILSTFTNTLYASKKETNKLYTAWQIDNVKFYTNDNDRVCLYNSDDEIFIQTIEDGELDWKKKIEGSIKSFNNMYCHSTGGYPLIFTLDDEKTTVSWYNLEGEHFPNKAGGPHIFNIGPTIITRETKVNGNNYIYDAATGKLLKTISKKTLNNGYIIDFENSNIYYVLHYIIRAQNNDTILWENIIRNWSNDDETEYYKEEYQYIYVPSDDYLFIRSVYFKGCCIYKEGLDYYRNPNLLK